MLLQKTSKTTRTINHIQMKIGNETISTLAYIPCHYGLSYLEAAITSIHPFVDKILILYSSKPTYGHAGSVTNPDKMSDISKVCHKFTKIVFQDVTGLGISAENKHRDLAYLYAKQQRESRSGLNFDLVLAVDADEIHDQAYIPELLHAGFLSNYHYHNVRGSQWFHFWKGHKEVNVDGFAPMRLVNLNNNVKNTNHIEVGRIYHMGYAIKREEMEYKLSCHGHKNEIAGSWYRDKWLNYERGKTKFLHPATDAYWIETEDFAGKLPDYMPNPYH